MATQPAAPRPWFRLASIRQPAPPTEPPAQPRPPAPQPRPPLARPAFRPVVTQPRPPPPPPPPQEPTPPPPPPPPAVATAPPPPPRSPPVTTLSPPQPTTTTAPPSIPPPPTAVPQPPSPTITTATQLPKAPSPPPPPTTITTTPPPSPTITAPTQLPKAPSPIRAPITGSVPPSPTPPSPARTIRPAVVVTQTVPPQESPKLTTFAAARPPSPLVLPPSLVKPDTGEPEQKTVLVQETINHQKKPWPNGKSPDQGYKETTTTTTMKPKIDILGHLGKKEAAETKAKSTKKVWSSDTDQEQMGMRVITIAGENKGAFMEVIRSPNSSQKKKPNGNGWGSYVSSSSGEEGTPRGNRTKGPASPSSTSSPPMSAFMNSNVQGVNNSIVYNSSCTDHDPGIHLSFSRKPASAAHGLPQAKDRTNGYQS